jgi:hypothetical protein
MADPAPSKGDFWLGMAIVFLVIPGLSGLLYVVPALPFVRSFGTPPAPNVMLAVGPVAFVGFILWAITKGRRGIVKGMLVGTGIQLLIGILLIAVLFAFLSAFGKSWGG